jgi:hypothetical protein
VSRTAHRPLASAGLLAVGMLLLTGCSAVQGLAGGVEPERDETTGEIVEAAQADAFSLRVGDCVDALATGDSEEVESMPTVPCADEHDGEVYASHLIDDAEYPWEESVATQADELCYADFQPFVGTAYEDSALDYTTLFPTGDSWKHLDDREILCIVVDPSAGVTGTLQAAQY